MDAALSPTLAAAVDAIRAARPDWRVAAFASIGSTSDEAHRLGPLSGSREPVLVLADHQTAGRGQQGRAWHDVPAKSFLGTLAMPVTPNPSLLWSFQVACAVADVLELLTCCALEWKWPNDVLLNGGKVCGVLSEVRGGWLLAGVGVNLLQENSDLPPRMAGVPRATSLVAELGGRAPDRAEAVVAIAGALIARLESPLPTDVLLGAVRKRWRGAGRAARVRHGDGTLEGVMEDIDGEGRLIVRTAGRIVRVASPLELAPGE